MIDYYADQVSLSHFTTALSAAALPEPAVASARDQALAAVDAEPGAALLGAFPPSPATACGLRRRRAGPAVQGR